MFRLAVILIVITICGKLNAQQPRLVLQAGHTDQINSINFSPDEKRVVSGGRGGDVRIWETYSGRLMHTLELPQGLMINEARYHANGKYILVKCFKGYSDAHLYIWNPETGNKGLLSLSSTEMARDIRFCPGDSTVLVRYPDGAVKWVGVPNGEKLLYLSPKNGYQINIDAAAIGKQLLFLPTYNDTAYLFDIKTKKQVTILKGIKAVKANFSSDGKSYTVITPTEVRKYDAQSTAPIAIKKLPHLGDETRAVISYSGNKILYHNYDVVYEIDLSSTAQAYELKEARAEHRSTRIIGAGYSTDDKTRTISYETGLILFKSTTTDSIYYYDGITYSHTGNYFLAKSDKNIYLFKANTRRKVTTYTSRMNTIYGKGISDAGKAYFNIINGAVFNLDINNQNITNTYQLPQNTLPVYGFDISARSNLMAYWKESKVDDEWGFSTNGYDLEVMHLPTGKIVGGVKGYSYKGELLFSPDGEKILNRTRSQSQLIDCRTGKEVFSIRTGSKTDNFQKPAVFSFNSEIAAILSAKDDEEIDFVDDEGNNFTNGSSAEIAGYYLIILNTKTGKTINEINLGKFPISDFGLIAEGKYAYSLQNSTIKIWDTKTGDFLYDLRQEGQYPSVIQPLKNNMLATAFAGKTIKVWTIGKNKPDALTSKTSAKAKLIVPLESKRFISVHSDYTFTLWQQGDKLEKKYTVDLKGDCQNMWANESRNEIITITRDYYIDKYKLSTGEYIGSFIITGDGSLVSFNTEGYYKASANTSRYMAWGLDGELYDFDQWDVQYNRPDKVLKSMGCDDEELINAFAQAREKRLKRAGITEQQLQAGYKLPFIKINNKTKLEGETSNSLIELAITAWDEAANNQIKKIIITVNGNPLYGVNGLDISSNKTSNKELKIAVPLSYGTNTIKVSCVNNKGAESLREALYVNYEPASKTASKNWFVGIGVSDYADAKHNLTYAKKDAQDLAAAFGANKNTETIIIANADATRENILKIKQRLLKESSVNDAVIISLSGHGVVDDDYNFYFATHDVDFINPAAKGLGYNDILWLLDSIPARKKLVLMDACHSGELDKEEIKGIEELNQHPADTNVRAMRSGIELLVNEDENKKLGFGSTFDLMQELFANIGHGNGATIISAAAGTEFAFEGNKWKNGVFTYCVLKGLAEKQADTNNDGEISVSELQNYVSQNVQQLTNGRQRPTGRQINFDNDWVVWK